MIVNKNSKCVNDQGTIPIVSEKQKIPISAVIS